MPSTRIKCEAQEFLNFDFTNTSKLKKTIKDNNLIIILGNTIANEMDMEEYLTNLRKDTPKNTNLLIGIELIKDASVLEINSIIEEYNCKENKSLTVSPINFLEVLPSVGKLKIVYNNELSRIEERFIFIKPTYINIENRKLRFNKDDYLLLSITNKPNLKSFLRITKNSGWIMIVKRNIKNQYLMLLQKEKEE